MMAKQGFDDDGHFALCLSAESETTPGEGVDHKTSGQSTLNLYQSVLADQRRELQKLLTDWGKSQDQVFDRMLAACASPCASLAQGFDHEQTQHRPRSPRSHESPRDFDNGSDIHVKPMFESETSVIQIESQGRGSDLASLKASRGFNNRRSTSFLKVEEPGLHVGDSFLSENGLTRYILSLMHWSEVKYKQGEACIRDKENANFLTLMVLGNRFQVLTGVIILANSIFLGYASDYAMQNLQDPSTPALNTVEAAFTVFYAVELILRVIALGWFFIFSPDWAWNLFDAFLVVSSSWGVISEMIGGKSGSNSSVLRTARFPKMIRLLRAFRIFRSFRELRILLNLIAGSMKPMLWVSLLISVVSYVFSNVFLQAATGALQDGMDGSDQNITDSVRDHIEKYWSSLADAMLNLYCAVAGGIDWKDMAMSVLPFGVGYCVLFLLYIAFFLFVITNTLTSLFLSTALNHAETDQQSMIYNELRKKHETIHKIKAVFKSITKHHVDVISKEDMDKVVQDPKMMAFMSSVGIDSADVEEFFNVLSDDGQQAVDIEAFVVGCMKMRGTARSMDLLGLIHRHNIDTMNFKQIEKRLAQLQQSIGGLVLLQQKDRDHRYHAPADHQKTSMRV